MFLQVSRTILMTYVPSLRRRLAASCALIFSLVSAGAPSFSAETLKIVDLDGLAVPGAVVFARDAVERAPDKTGDTGDRASTPPEQVKTSLSIDQRDKRFTPHVSVVSPGAAVAFPNSDDIRHHVYSFSEGNSFERKLYRSNDAEPVVFAAEGVAALGCNIHDNMQAFVVVTDRETLGVSDVAGMIEIRATQASDEVEVWHPQINAEGISISVAVERRNGTAIIALPFRWQDPQAVRSTSDLEALLKQFSKDAP